MDITTIQSLFPEPVRHTGDNDACAYCVGAAFVLTSYEWQYNGYIGSFGHDKRFPDEATLASAFQRHNPRLTPERAYAYADLLIYYNDRERFNMAWAMAEQALVDDGTQNLPEYDDGNENHE